MTLLTHTLSLMTSHCHSAVEIGAMTGMQISALSHIRKRAGVEAFQPYLEHWYDEQVTPVFGEALQWLQSQPDRSWDAILFLDVIEHMQKTHAQECLEQSQRVANKRMIVFVPLGTCPQTAEDSREKLSRSAVTQPISVLENQLQAHVSEWTERDFPSPPWTVIVNHIPGIHQHLFAVWNRDER